MNYQITNIDGEILQRFETYHEALEYVLKLGDQSILAKINAPFQSENPVEA